MAGAVLAGVGVAAVPSAAHALPTAVTVACNTPALIAAITAANSANAQTLTLARNCTYDLTAPFVQPSTRGPNGLPIIAGRITLEGKNTTIRRKAVEPFRILEVAPGALLNARGITFSGGDAGVNTGGGILNARGRVLLFLSLVVNNTADNGAGISNDSGALRLVSSTVRNNQVRTDGGGGGGIYNGGFLAVKFSRVTLNRANTNGGGIFNELGGRASIYRSDIVANTAMINGGGIFNAAGGAMRGDLVRIQFNQALSGGGVFNAGSPGDVISRSAIIANSSPNCAPVGTVQGCAT